jgi:hypothetical protein
MLLFIHQERLSSIVQECCVQEQMKCKLIMLAVCTLLRYSYSTMTKWVSSRLTAPLTAYMAPTCMLRVAIPLMLMLPCILHPLPYLFSVQ